MAAKRTSGPSGKSRTRAERIEAGFEPVDVMLPPEIAPIYRRLLVEVGGGSRTQTLVLALLALYEQRFGAAKKATGP